MKCLYNCNLKTSDGYCQLTACINPEHNGSGTYIVSENYYITETQYIPTEIQNNSTDLK